MTGLNSSTVLSDLVSLAQTLGVFSTVNSHELRNAPASPLVLELWLDRVTPLASQSGLAATSALVIWNGRIRISANAEPLDNQDVVVLNAVDALMAAYSGDFSLSGDAACIDLLGLSGASLQARAGFLLQDNKQYRVMDITIPVIVNDAFPQVA